MIRPENLPEFVALTEQHTSIFGKTTGVPYHTNECFVVLGFRVIQETDFIVVTDSSGNETCLPAVIVEKALVCPWHCPLAV